MTNQRYGKYQVLEPLGQGGFGTVFLGLDPELNRKVAIKTCNSPDRHLRDRFRREARIAASLQHSAIVTVFDSGEENGVPYLVQEYLAGEDLSTLINREAQQSQERKIGYLIEIARGLSFAHAQGIVHRDIKPANIRVLPDGRIKILDFGIAKLLQAESHLTRTGMTMGTAGYMPPEQILGKPVDQRADIFAFGVLAYELLTGHQPFAGDDLSAVFYRILHEEPKPIPELWPGCPVELAEGLRRCLEKDPEDRHSSFAPVLALLAPFADRSETSSELPLIGASLGPGARLPAPAWSSNRKAGSRLSAWQSFSESAYRTGLRLRRMSLLGVLGAVSLAAVAVLGVWYIPSLWQQPSEPPPLTEPPAPQATPSPQKQPPVGPETPPPVAKPRQDPQNPVQPEPGRQTEPRAKRLDVALPPVAPSSIPREATSETKPDSSRTVPPSPIETQLSLEQKVKDRSEEHGGGEIDRATPLLSSTTRIVVVIRGAEGSGVPTTETALLRELTSLGLSPEAARGISPTDRDSVLSGAPGAVAEVARKLGADLLLAGELTSEVQPTVSRFFAGRAVLELRLYEASGGRLLRAETVAVGGASGAAKAGGSELAARTAAAEEVGRRAARLVASLTSPNRSLSLSRAQDTPRLAAAPAGGKQYSTQTLTSLKEPSDANFQNFLPRLARRTLRHPLRNASGSAVGRGRPRDRLLGQLLQVHPKRRRRRIPDSEREVCPVSH